MLAKQLFCCGKAFGSLRAVFRIWGNGDIGGRNGIFDRSGFVKRFGAGSRSSAQGTTGASCSCRAFLCCFGICSVILRINDDQLTFKGCGFPFAFNVDKILNIFFLFFCTFPFFDVVFKLCPIGGEKLVFFKRSVTRREYGEKHASPNKCRGRILDGVGRKSVVPPTRDRREGYTQELHRTPIFCCAIFAYQEQQSKRGANKKRV